MCLQRLQIKIYYIKMKHNHIGLYCNCEEICNELHHICIKLIYIVCHQMHILNEYIAYISCHVYTILYTCDILLSAFANIRYSSSFITQVSQSAEGNVINSCFNTNFSAPCHRQMAFLFDIPATRGTCCAFVTIRQTSPPIVNDSQSIAL